MAGLVSAAITIECKIVAVHTVADDEYDSGGPEGVDLWLECVGIVVDILADILKMAPGRAGLCDGTGPACPKQDRVQFAPGLQRVSDSNEQADE